MTDNAPHSPITRFEHIHEIYYGTDDGFSELRPREERVHDATHIAGLNEVFARYQNFYEQVPPSRRANIHLASIAGGLYGLNLIPLFQPKQITFIDCNPHAITLFNVIRRAWIGSKSAIHFLDRLSDAKVEVETAQEQEIRDCLAAKQNGTLAEEKGRSARSLLSSWRYALDRFDLTRDLLANVQTNTLIDSVQSSSFQDFVASQENLWTYLSNVLLFSTFDLHFEYPANAALFASYYDKTDMLDLGVQGPGPLTVHCRIPMSVAGHSTHL